MWLEKSIGSGFDFIIENMLWLAAWLAHVRDAFLTRARRLRGSLRRVLRSWRRWDGTSAVTVPFSRGHQAWNRTPEEDENAVCRMYIDLRRPGARKLADMIFRVLGRSMSHQTVWRILVRKRDLLRELEQGRAAPPKRIDIPKGQVLWGLDLTRVFIVGLIPVWVLGVVDYCGSRVVVFEPLGVTAPSDRIIERLQRAFAEHGKPKRILTDNGSNLCSEAMDAFLCANGIRHQRTGPCRPWTNGRIERVFRSAKETIFSLVWLIRSRDQLERFCRDFKLWHNRDRPHMSYGGRTPDEVYFGHAKRTRCTERITYFDGLMPWYRLA